MTVTRRKFLSRTAAGVGALGLTGLVPSGLVPSAFARHEIMPKNGPRVVVIGGGWGGTTAAKYIFLGCQPELC